MIANQVALVRREFWEHRSLYIVPAVLGVILVLVVITGRTSISAFGTHVDMALLGATNITANVRGAVINVFLAAFASLFVLEMLILTVFYSLDALYAERKDKSILFWRSMPVTDAETVISKLITALILIPLVTLAVVAATHFIILVVTSIWIGLRGANAWHLIWSSVPLLDNWSATLIFVLSVSLWLSPFVGWFLLVSAYTKRSPMLIAVLPILLLPMLERSILGSRLLFDAIIVRVGRIPIFNSDEFDSMLNDQSLTEAAHDGISLVSMLDVGGFLASPGLWAGLIVCGLFVTAAIYVRRFRGDS
jgi:ABC-2 type transport system permease protein